MAKLGGIYVSVRARTDKYKRDLAAAKTITKKSVVVLQKHISSINFKQVGVAVLAFAATFAFAMKKAIDAASDLEETVGKFDVVFKDHARQAEDMAKVLVDSYAMSTREAKQFLSSVQDLLVPMGMASDQAIIMSNEVVKLAADLGSFNNLPTAQVMLDIQSALVGNFETMKKYGVVLNETVIKQEALNQELWDGKGMVNANVKAYVAFNLMLKGSAAALGDQQRTMGSYANQMKQLKANIEDISATIGNELIPQVTEYINQINIVIKQNPEIVKEIGITAKAILDFAALIGKAVFKLVEWNAAFVKTLQATKLASAGIISWKDALINGVDVIDTINEALEGHRHKIDKATEGFELYKKALTGAATPALLPPPPSTGSIATISAKTSKPGNIDDLLKEMEAKAAIVADFNLKFEELGLNRFEIERLQLEREVDIYRKAGVDKNKIDQFVSKRSIDIARAEQQAKLDIYKNIAGGIAGTFQDIAQAGGKYSKEAFVIYKATAMAQAAIAGYQAVLVALASAPPPFNFILAAISGAAAAVQIGLIASSQPPSFDNGGISNAGGVYQTGNIREAHIPIPSGKIPVDLGNGGGQQPVQIILENPVFQDLATQRRVMEQIASVIATRVAPGAIVANYQNDGPVRQMVRGRV